MRSKNASTTRLMLGALLALVFSGNVFAADKKAATPAAKAAPAATQKDEKVDISDLENKYWAPKDTDFSVVQNRTYTKEKQFFVSFQYGIPTSEVFSTGSYYGLTGNYFFTERHGIELTYQKADLHNSDAVSGLQNFGTTGVFPDHGRDDYYVGAAYNFVPFYSKMSVMGKKIIYFDMAISPSLGLTRYDQMMKDGNSAQTAFTYGLDVTQFYFFSNHWAVRLDWKNQWYNQKVVKYENTGGMLEGAPAGSKNVHDSTLMLGMTFFFGPRK